MKCPNCGADCTEEMNFCNECGTRLNNAKPEENKIEEAVKTDAAQPVQQNEPETTEQEQTAEAAEAAVENPNEPEEKVQPEELTVQPEKPVQDEAGQSFPQLDAPDGPELSQTVPEFIPPADEFASQIPEEDKPVKVGGLRITGASVITFFSVIILLCVTLISSVKLGVTGDKIEKNIKDLDTWTFVSSNLDDRIVADNLFGELYFGTATRYVYDESDFHRFLGESDILDFVGETAGEYVDYIFNGKGKAPTLDAGDITDFIKDNAESYNKTFANAIDYKVIESAIEDNNTLDHFDISEIEKEIGASVDTIRYGISYLTIGILAALLIVLMIWIAVIVDRKARFLLGFYGNIFKWSGIASFIVGLAIGGGTAVLHVASNEAVIYLLAAAALPVGVWAMIIGFSLWLLGFVFGKIKSSIKNKEKRSKAVEAALASEN
ncbi:MAG: hypothetical protein NC093_04505 [Alistipes sp.]|nr:hypothetical protein [Alistipes sp.]